MGHFVNAPLVVARQENGTDIYLYQGAPVPPSVKADEVKRLVADGLLTKNAEEAADDSEPKAPAKSASKEDWVTYAQAKGDADAESKTKEQLVSDHGDS